ncbi:hypothetical protein ACSRUE_16665 [Sorangium sp. KYC3313]
MDELTGRVVTIAPQVFVSTLDERWLGKDTYEHKHIEREGRPVSQR